MSLTVWPLLTSICPTISLTPPALTFPPGSCGDPPGYLIVCVCLREQMQAAQVSTRDALVDGWMQRAEPVALRDLFVAEAVELEVPDPNSLTT